MRVFSHEDMHTEGAISLAFGVTTNHAPSRLPAAANIGRASHAARFSRRRPSSGSGRRSRRFTVRARRGWFSALRVFLCQNSESVFYGAFVWACRAPNRPKRRFPARAVYRDAREAKRERGFSAFDGDAFVRRPTGVRRPHKLAPQRKLYRVGPNCETWPSILTESPY
jgi:hypothetical protein